MVERRVRALVTTENEMATVWIRGGLIAWLKGSPETRRADTPLRGRKQEGDDEPLYDQAALDAAVMAEREACAMACEAEAQGWRDSDAEGSESLAYEDKALESAARAIRMRSNG